jgi:hypothetical protein
MSFTRRNFVHTTALTVLAGITMPSSFGKEQDETFSADNLVGLYGLTRQKFDRVIGESFAVTLDNRSMGRLTLVAVKDYKPFTPKQKPSMTAHKQKSSPQESSSYSVQFRGTGKTMAQETYVLKNPSLGSMVLLLVPSQPGEAKPTYTAVFNTLEK